MNDNNLIKKIQNDIIYSNAKIINNNDNLSIIKKNFNSKYTEDISDSDEELSSYKNRNLNIINQLDNKKKTKKKNINEELEEIEKEINNNIKINNNVKINNELTDNSDKSCNESVEYEYTNELKNKVKEYVKNDDRIRELQTELKTLNNAKKTVEADILKHLERLGETNINITGGKLRINQYESKEGLKEDIVKEALGEKIKDPKIIETIFDKINEKRTAGSKVQVSLKRTFERSGKNKK